MVEGGLGPVLRHALEPDLNSETQACTAFKASVPDTMDLVDLVLVLQGSGVQVHGIVRADDPVQGPTARPPGTLPGNQS